MRDVLRYDKEAVVCLAMAVRLRNVRKSEVLPVRRIATRRTSHVSRVLLSKKRSYAAYAK